MAAVSLVCVLGAGPSPHAFAAEPDPQLPSGDRWLKHFEEDLLPFWNVPDAWGTPRGNFPTFRCNDGSLFVAKNPCPELANPPAWIKQEMTRDYVRMKSRQTYFYSVAYHLTGDPAMLALALAGANYIRTHALDAATGSAVSYWEDGRAEPPVLQRTSQDLAYAALALAIVYYLTRDETMLADLTRLKDHIFAKYWNDSWGMLMWVAQDNSAGDAARKELVSQLDQINGYMLLVTPLLPAVQRKQWSAELVKLANVMIDQYFAPEQHMFWGTIHNPRDKKLGSRHTDFGHSAKALWMIERVGRLAGDKALVDFAVSEAGALLQRAYLADSGSWGSRPLESGKIDTGKEWWIYAELDQLAATLALRDPLQARVLPRTYDFWLRYMVDHKNHEVWGWVGADKGSSDGPKIHQWKNGYHSAEHALVSYLTTQALQGQSATLYFAFRTSVASARPYYYSGKVMDSETTDLAGIEGFKKVKVRFTEIR